MLDQLAHVLSLRGFLITKMDDHIYFSRGNHEDELSELEEMFKKVNIAVRVDGRKIYLLDGDITKKDLDQLIWYSVQQEAGGGNAWRSWGYFITRNHGPKVNTFILETGVALFVKALSAAGIVTIMSCDGHGKGRPCITFCGKQNAIWFCTLFNEIKDNLKLNYEWYFHDVDGLDIHFVAKRRQNEWNLEKVLEDTMQMAEYFLNESENLSKLKKDIFGRKYKSTRRLVHQMDYAQMNKWMRTKYKNYIRSQVEVKIH
ncbi:hypothetical protein [Bacillus sp. AFS031507]|uniref:hypothetical protein n=1 Tax=Bacillus sp. AFS031507 TaxID=2033496 RepID=UPI000BFC13D7|nr:hypothetical protein [Bacillus sp. AFS031507]PGY09110.1 hypothetical protein COE25_18755 [Bacillus sp. AFS031507]